MIRPFVIFPLSGLQLLLLLLLLLQIALHLLRQLQLPIRHLRPPHIILVPTLLLLVPDPLVLAPQTPDRLLQHILLLRLGRQHVHDLISGVIGARIFVLPFRYGPQQLVRLPEQVSGVVDTRPERGRVGGVGGVFERDAVGVGGLLDAVEIAGHAAPAVAVQAGEVDEQRAVAALEDGGEVVRVVVGMGALLRGVEPRPWRVQHHVLVLVALGDALKELLILGVGFGGLLRVELGLGEDGDEEADGSFVDAEEER